MSFNPRELYLSRRKANVEHFAPYLRYVAQSGLLLVIAFLAIAFIDQYIKLIKYTPEQFPLAIVATIVLSFGILFSPFRTYLKPADIIYVMPKQQEMIKYFDYCRQRGYLLSFIPFLTVLVLTYFVLSAYEYEQSTKILLPLLVLKQATYHILYSVKSIHHKLVMHSIKLITVLTVIVTTYMLIENSFIPFFIAVIILIALYIYVYMQTSKFTNWNQLIEDEQKKLHNTNRFLNLFVDIPQVNSATKKRPYLAQFAQTIKFGRPQTFSYLHYLSFARSEVGGIYVRNIVVGAVISSVMAYTMLWNGFASLFFAITFISINAVQLSTLRQMHRHSVWQNIYPIPLEQQHKQMTSIELKLLLISAICIIVIPAFTFIVAGVWELVLYLSISMLITILWRIAVIRNRVKKSLK